jgi:hypothetical protein
MDSFADQQRRTADLARAFDEVEEEIELPTVDEDEASASTQLASAARAVQEVRGTMESLRISNLPPLPSVGQATVLTLNRSGSASSKAIVQVSVAAEPTKAPAPVAKRTTRGAAKSGATATTPTAAPKKPTRTRKNGKGKLTEDL